MTPFFSNRVVFGWRSLILILLISPAAEFGFQRAKGGEDQPGNEPNISYLLKELRQSAARILPQNDQLPEAERMVPNDVAERLRAASQRSTADWKKIQGRDAWEAFRDAKLEQLRNALGKSLPIPQSTPHVVTRTIAGDGYRVDNILFESRPGVFVTANLYVPVPARESMPGFLICHSHHNSKTQSELQDMGIMWARHGCVVLVPDQLGHGERRQHPFRTEADYDGDFRPGRQDYYFRYVSGMQLHVIGESLAGWMAWDMQRGIDVLLSIPGIDKKRIAMLGSVAGGGDPTAVAAALDRRVTAVVPFNFGGPQPETRFPLPEDAEDQFRYTGSGSWESTRNLTRSAGDGFLPWVIVAASAPRRLVYAHEFQWDREHDPVWRRLQTVFEWEGCPEHLAFTLGYGSVTGRPPNASHCNNIGRHHRKKIHEAFEAWFGLPVPEDEPQNGHDSSTLRVIREDGTPPHGDPLHLVAQKLAAERGAQLREALAKLPSAARQSRLKDIWAGLLGISASKPTPVAVSADVTKSNGLQVVKGIIRTEREILVPYLLLIPAEQSEALPCVVCVAQGGKREFLETRQDEVAGLLDAGLAVCLPDLRGMGETALGSERGRRSWATGVSSSELMLGGTLLGNQLTDLRCVLAMLRDQKGIDAKRLAVFGDGLTKANSEEIDGRVPLDAPEIPPSEPAGPFLAQLCGLFEPDLKASVSHGGVWGYAALLEGPFVAFPHDSLVPGALTAGDMADVVAVQTPRPFWISGVVDGLNRPIPEDQAASRYEIVQKAYAPQADRFNLARNMEADALKAWLQAALQAGD